MRLTALVLLCLCLSGCWFGNDEIRRRLETGETAQVVVPEGLDQPDFVDAMPIPDVDDPRGLADREYVIGLPDALSTTFGVEKIVIRKLGELRWVFLDMPPATVWPKVLEYLASSNLTVEKADPGTGYIETAWLPSVSGQGDALFESLKLGNPLRSPETQQHKMLIRVEPGVRTASTEISLTHRRLNIYGPQRLDSVSWIDGSDDPELEQAILTGMAYDLGETITEGQTVSLVATALQTSRSELVPDRERPVLKYRLDFNRAWATVGAALESARINVEDLNRSEAYYYVYYSTDFDPGEPGFFAKLFPWGSDNVELNQENMYIVHLTPAGEEVHVTVYKDQEQLADSLVAERLLKIIKEYST